MKKAIRNDLIERVQNSPISAVDLFCGAGGLTHGLMISGIRVEAGIEIDKQVEYAFRANNPGVEFLRWDVARKNYQSIQKLFRPGSIRLLAGCAPCQPFSKLTNGAGKHKDWDLLDNFGRFVRKILPELVTMENVPELEERGSDVYIRFVRTLKECGYSVAAEVVRCEDYGIPQSRRRLVLLASRLGEIALPEGRYRNPSRWRTVRQAIGTLRPLASGEADPGDPLHVASLLSRTNLERIRATPRDGGTRKHWPDRLVLACHQRHTGKSYGSIYGRMWWDRPGPTMTTLCTGIGNGRFGHPEQDRAITLREAALLQSFPRTYDFWPREEKLNRKAVGRMIGNAVPPKLARALGEALLSHVEAETSTKKVLP
ncbi:MAG: DNA cytosine methyltransferase [Candidatus Manganitrophus sp.]|nr:DNA cytosine methyltransferase [Candidatus Manganitrophus sp.]MDC4227778.1 DNA cytosine methyltransferase [Candidatus Manganitrophus sp.]WDT70873.1 MAG: DNA cytosine methyltransferase [Candidatus Manganitrophus sp.]WDT81856.1 MAG: DNA cytosine methyltransferase [Candidatus Manganitrophus sp.]